MNVATTHMGVLTSSGMVYTWGLGKSGQLVRPDDDSRTLELIDTEDRAFVATDICCGGDCTFVIEKDSHRCYGCGFNSSGQVCNITIKSRVHGISCGTVKYLFYDCFKI